MITELENFILIKGNKCFFDIEDKKKFSKKKLYLSTYGYITTFEYNKKMNRSKTIFIHKLINNTPERFDTDHINGNKLDNRKQNLRSVSRSENSMNKRKSKNSTSGHKNISWDKQMKAWRVQIMKNYKNVYNKLFKDIDIAVIERNKALKKFHGIYASFN